MSSVMLSLSCVVSHTLRSVNTTFMFPHVFSSCLFLTFTSRILKTLIIRMHKRQTPFSQRRIHLLQSFYPSDKPFAFPRSGLIAPNELCWPVPEIVRINAH